MRNKLTSILIFFVLYFFISQDGFAIRTSRPTALDSRIRVMAYSPNDVFTFTGYYGYQTCIELDKNESVVSISLGDTTGWQIIPSGNRIFLKPIESDATTNMTLITNKRTYFFELYGKEATDIRDPDMVFTVRFIYPDDPDSDSSITKYATKEYFPDLSHPENLNFNYMISGSRTIEPEKIFDDGEFIFIQFPDKNSKIPAIFSVDDKRHESMVNYRVSSNNRNIIVIEKVYKKMALRLNKEIVCIFNERFK